MKNKFVLSCFIIALGVFSCENRNTAESHGDKEKDRTNAIGVQGTEVEETSNSSETSDPDRTEPKDDTLSFKEQNQKQ